MIISDDFVFVHNPRTGGAFVKTLFKHYIDINKYRPLEEYHLPASKIPAKDKSKMSFGMVRNPWSWYVSLYHFQQPRGKWLRMTKATSFDTFIKVFLSDEFIQSNESKLFYPVGNPRAKATVPKFKYMNDLGVGFFSYRYIYMFFDDYEEIFASKNLDRLKNNHNKLISVDNILKTEQMPENIVTLLSRNGTPVPKHVLPKWRASKKKNHTIHEPYRSYYNDKTAELVAAKDSIIIDKYNYRF